MRPHSTTVKPLRPSVLALSLALSLTLPAGCGKAAPEGPSGLEIGVRRVPLGLAAMEDPEPTAEVALHIDPRSGIDTWEIEASEWSFEGAGTRTRPLRLMGQGDKRVSVPGPFDVPAFDRLRVLVASPTRGELRATIVLDNGVELKGEAEADKSRVEHPVTIRLPRAVRPDETIESLVLDVDIKRASTIHGIDLIRQPLLEMLPSAETGFDIVTVGSIGRRAVGLGAGHRIDGTLDSEEGDALTFWAAKLEGQSGREDKGAKVVVMLTPRGELALAGTPGKTASAQLTSDWAEVRLAGLPKGEFGITVRVEAENDDTVAVVGQPELVHPEWEGPLGAAAPSTLVVTSSSHRADHLGGMIPADVGPLKTPALDALAAAGLSFGFAWSVSHLSVPAYAALMTGVHPRDTKVLNDQHRLRGDGLQRPLTLAEAFAERGYRTVAVLGSRSQSHVRTGLGRGFDVVVLPAEGLQSPAEAVAALEAQLADQGPTFVWLSFGDTGAGDQSGEAYRTAMASVDAALGGLVSQPRFRAGVVAFTADHGLGRDPTGDMTASAGPLPETLRVPLILRYPNASEPGARVMDPVSTMDLGSTVLAISGFGAEEFPGTDLTQPALEPKAHFTVSGGFASITKDGWHAVLDLGDSMRDHAAATERHQLQLFELGQDPRCENDVASEQPREAASLHRELSAWVLEKDSLLFEADCACSQCLLFK